MVGNVVALPMREPKGAAPGETTREHCRAVCADPWRYPAGTMGYIPYRVHDVLSNEPAPSLKRKPSICGSNKLSA